MGDDLQPLRLAKYQAMIEYLVTVSALTTSPETKTILKDYAEILHEQSVEQTCAQVKFFCVRKMYHKPGKALKARLSLNVDGLPATVKQALIDTLKGYGARVLIGRAPPGSMERKLGRWLAGMA